VADRFIQCRHKAVVFFDFAKRQDRLAKCLVKYLASASKLPCDPPRFTDNGDGTVTDNVTALQWEQKTDDSGVHDRDNLYSWSASGTAADGSVFTSLLATLNQSGCARRPPRLATAHPAELRVQVAPFGSCPEHRSSSLGRCDVSVLVSAQRGRSDAAWDTTSVGARS
jgi:hypothetical protein